MADDDVICRQYEDLELKCSLSLKKEDIPQEFSDAALRTVNQFIQKTHDLDYEWALYFDYMSGEILKCARGGEDNVSVAFQDGEFDGYHVASIHNHPKDILSPPSGKNFGILKRGFEDYELIAGFESFWILKAKGMHKNLINDFNEASQTTFNLALMFCIGRYNQIEMINKMHDIRYGSELSKYINNKNIDDIQLIKREYTDMASKIADYKCRKHITDPETIRLLKEFENSPYTPSAKEMMYDFYQKVGMDVEWDEIFAD